MAEPTYGPHYIEVRAIPTGATLNVRALVADLLHEIATGRDGRLLDELYAYAEAMETGSRPDPHEPEPARMEHLLDALDPQVHVYGAEVGRLSQRLAAIARPNPVTEQQHRRAS